MGQISPESCDRVRELFSTSLDGELTELDEARLQMHLASCAGCRTYADSAAAAARLVRMTPLEEPSFQIVVPGRRLAVARRLQGLAAAAAIVVTVGLSGAVGSVSGPGGTHARRANVSENMRFPEQELHMLQRASEIRQAARAGNRFAF
jgi:putative zinc finger protein